MIREAKKIIKDDDAIATIKFKVGTAEDLINKIDNLISKYYDQECEYIIKIDKNTYKGDMACLSGLGNHVIKALETSGLKNYIIEYTIYNKRTNELEDFLEV